MADEDELMDCDSNCSGCSNFTEIKEEVGLSEIDTDDNDESGIRNEVEEYIYGENYYKITEKDIPMDVLVAKCIICEKNGLSKTIKGQCSSRSNFRRHLGVNKFYFVDFIVQKDIFFGIFFN